MNTYTRDQLRDARAHIQEAGEILQGIVAALPENFPWRDKDKISSIERGVYYDFRQIDEFLYERGC